MRLKQSASQQLKKSKRSYDWEARNKAMRDLKDGMNKNYQGLKRKISKLRSKAHQDLKAVSKLSEDIQTDLRKKLNIAENILKLGHLNSKVR